MCWLGVNIFVMVLAFEHKSEKIVQSMFLFSIVCHQKTISFSSWSRPLCKTILSWCASCWQWRQLSKSLTGVFNRRTYNVTAKSVSWLNWATSKCCVRKKNKCNPNKKNTEIVHFKSRKQNARFFVEQCCMTARFTSRATSIIPFCNVPSTTTTYNNEHSCNNAQICPEGKTWKKEIRKWRAKRANTYVGPWMFWLFQEGHLIPENDFYSSHSKSSSQDDSAQAAKLCLPQLFAFLRIV